MRIFTAGLSIALLACASQASAQVRPLPFPTIEIAPQWQSHDAPSPRVPEPAFQSESSGHHIVTGFLIGAVIGGAAGWLFYNAICEAVDNHCTDSRVRLVLLGGVTGGALGALVGSGSD